MNPENVVDSFAGANSFAHNPLFVRMNSPTMTLILGALLGWVMLSVLSPIYDIIGKVQF